MYIVRNLHRMVNFLLETALVAKRIYQRIVTLEWLLDIVILDEFMIYFILFIFAQTWIVHATTTPHDVNTN